MFVNALVWSRRRTRHWRRCLRRYQKRLKKLTCSHHDQFSLLFEKKTRRQRSTLVPLEFRSRVEVVCREKEREREKEEREKRERKKKSENERKKERKEKREREKRRSSNRVSSIQVQISIKKISARDRLFKQRK